MICLSPHLYPLVKVPFDLLNQIEFIVNMHRSNGYEVGMDKNVNDWESFVQKISLSSCINLIDDSSIQSNAKKLIFTTEDELKEAFFGLY